MRHCLCLSVSACFPSLCLSPTPSLTLSLCLSVCVCLHVCLTLSLCLSLGLSVCLCVCLYLFVFVGVFRIANSSAVLWNVYSQQAFPFQSIPGSQLPSSFSSSSSLTHLLPSVPLLFRLLFALIFLLLFLRSPLFFFLLLCPTSSFSSFSSSFSASCCSSAWTEGVGFKYFPPPCPQFLSSPHSIWMAKKNSGFSHSPEADMNC